MKDKSFVVILSVCDYVAATNVKNELMNYMLLFFYKQHFYKQRQAEIAKKISSKC